MESNPLCEQTQFVIDTNSYQSFDFISKLKIFFHLKACPNCKEYQNRYKLFNHFLYNNKPYSARLNSYQNEILHKSKSVQERLASIPEMNPSPIIEIERSGKVSYQNPAFNKHFPNFTDIGDEHFLLKDFQPKFKELIEGKITSFSKEIFHNGFYFVKRAIYIPQLQVVRIFYLDITEQKKYEHIISEKNKEITSSIQYAKRIQEALFPSNNYFKSKFPESFVLYKPKDIVAGDFYWLAETDDYIYVAAADCTGHGVPGALVSVVCSSALNRSIKEFNLTETGKIFDKTQELVLETFHTEESNISDGMDISLLGINKKTNQAFWSGANNPLWYFSDGKTNEIIADKQPIGKSLHNVPFTTHSINLQKGDFIFLFTDGYADQFGGSKQKKFKYKQLQELLEKNIAKPAEELKTILEIAIDEWKGIQEQTDDILIMGIKI